MIAIFGGTTEGRVAAKVCDRAAKSYIYSTKGDEQQLLAQYALRISGALDLEAMVRMLREHSVELVVDAAHPYAELLHRNIAEAAEICGVPTIRFERLSEPCDYSAARYFDSLEEVVAHIKAERIENILALTGVKSAAMLAPIAQINRLTLRMMDREESHTELLRSGFPDSQVIYYDHDPSTRHHSDREICRNLSIEALITKESGASGGFSSKLSLARELSLPLYIIKRPALPEAATTVYGEFGLRRAIEQLLPSFFELRTGFTTGSAATAASAAALRAIIEQRFTVESVQITLPNGEPITIPVATTSLGDDYAECSVVKDGGDDPDATHNIEIVASVRLLRTSNESSEATISISGGCGVGRVTLPGIGIDVGEAAINPVPLKMIEQNLRQIADEAKLTGVTIAVEISVPRGEEIGAKTFNPRLGIIGGISILGTSGIVQPFSSEAFLEAIEQQIHIVKALNYNTIAINSGAMSERYVRRYKAELPSQCYIHYGNLIGATIELAASQGIKYLVVGCMIGKAVKLAKGALDTHSRNTTLDRDFIQELATESGCSEDTLLAISSITTARQLWSSIPRSEYALFVTIAQRCFDHCKPLLPDGELEFLLIGEGGDVEAVIKG